MAKSGLQCHEKLLQLLQSSLLAATTGDQIQYMHNLCIAITHPEPITSHLCRNKLVLVRM